MQTTQQQENPLIIPFKNGQKIWIDISQKKIYKYGQEVSEKMLNITNHQGNAKWNHGRYLTPEGMAVNVYTHAHVCYWRRCAERGTVPYGWQ
jgi:hypothetical protein